MGLSVIFLEFPCGAVGSKACCGQEVLGYHVLVSGKAAGAEAVTGQGVPCMLCSGSLILGGCIPRGPRILSKGGTLWSHLELNHSRGRMSKGAQPTGGPGKSSGCKVPQAWSVSGWFAPMSPG